MFLRHSTGFRSFSRKHGCISMGALEGSSDTNLREMSSRKRGRPRKEDCHINPSIITLDPNKFAEKNQRRLHIGSLQAFRPRISLLRQSSPLRASAFIYEAIRNEVKTRFHPYPPDTKAFLYYFTSPENPRIAGELRLRVTPSDDPASFESGSDLLRTDGRVWSRPLYITSKFYSPLYEKLREEGLVPDDLDRALSTLSSKKNPCRSRFLYTLNDTFIVDFSHSDSDFFIITELGVEWLSFRRPFSDGRNMRQVRPYTGSALVRFERSTLQDHNGTRIVVLRFLKIITPVKCVIPDYDGYICCPKEGELHRRSRKFFRMDQSVWSVNIDKSKGSMIPGLRLLWDA